MVNVYKYISIECMPIRVYNIEGPTHYVNLFTCNIYPNIKNTIFLVFVRKCIIFE